jgi:hypothetical protein
MLAHVRGILGMAVIIGASAVLGLLRPAPAQPTEERVVFEEAFEIAHDESPPLRDMRALTVARSRTCGFAPMIAMQC